MKYAALIFILFLSTQSWSHQSCLYYFARTDSIPYQLYKDNRTLGVKVKVEDFKGNSWVFDLGNSAYQYIKPSQKKRTVVLADIFQSGRSNKVYLLVYENDFNLRKTILLEFNLMKVKDGAKKIFESFNEIHPVDVLIPWKKNYIILTGNSISTGLRHDVKVSSNISYIVPLEGGYPISLLHSQSYYGMNRWARQAIVGYTKLYTEIKSVEVKSKVLYDGDVVWDKEGQFVLKKEGTRIEVSELDIPNKKLNTIQRIDLLDSDIPSEIHQIFGKISVTRN